MPLAGHQRSNENGRVTPPRLPLIRGGREGYFQERTIQRGGARSGTASRLIRMPPGRFPGILPSGSDAATGARGLGPGRRRKFPAADRSGRKPAQKGCLFYDSPKDSSTSTASAKLSRAALWAGVGGHSAGNRAHAGHPPGPRP